jgi:putative endonuclease
MKQQELGLFGENLAADHLKNKGYSIVCRNFRFKKNEVDIIALHRGKLIVVEVKTRHTSVVGEPWMAVSRAKQRAIVQVADQFLQSKQMNIETRFDVISIVHNGNTTQLEHIEDAFSPMI